MISCPAEVYLSSRRDVTKLYSESYNNVSVMFASIPNYMDFFTQEEIHEGGVTCLKILNHIIYAYDKVMSKRPGLMPTKLGRQRRVVSFFPVAV